MQRTAVMPTAKTLYEPEAVQQLPSPPPLPSQEQPRSDNTQGTRSPCTPPLQSIEQRSEKSASEVEGNRTDILDWSPQTPESLPVVSVLDTVADPAVHLTAALVEGADVLPTTAPPTAGTEAGGEVARALPPIDETRSEGAAVQVSSSEGEAAAAQRSTADKGAAASEQPERQPQPPPHAAPSIVSATHVDPQRDLRGAVQPSATQAGASAAGASSSSAGPSTAATELENIQHHGVFFPNGTDTSATAALVVAIAAYCDLPTLVQLMRVCRASHQLATSDEVWRPILQDLNLSPLLSAYDRTRDYYDFFLHEIITTRALHGHYTFQAANNASGSHGSISNASGSRIGAGGSNRDHIRDDDSLQEDVFNIASLQLLISAASLGQSNHLIGRVQLLLTYKNDSMEVLQGSCRFSIFRRCFSLCCSAFGTIKRGPVFTVAVATVTKPWANEGFQHFSEHKNGIRLVMTPVLWEGQSPGSQITEKDILVVSRPRPEAASAATAATAETSAPAQETPMPSRG